MDFLKQRRRWFVGLCLVCLRAPARLWHRITLVSSIILWGVGWLGWWSVSIAAVVVNARIPLAVLLIGTASLAAYSALYLLGSSSISTSGTALVPAAALAPLTGPAPAHLLVARKRGGHLRRDQTGFRLPRREEVSA